MNKHVATVVGVDEYGPRLEWTTHWNELVGAKLYTPSRRSAAGDQKQDDHAGSPAPSCYGVILAGKVMPVGSKEQAEKLADHAAAEIVPLYTHPAPSAESSKAALSDDEIDAIGIRYYGKGGWGGNTDRGFARAILARAGITRKPLTEEDRYQLQKCLSGGISMGWINEAQRDSIERGIFASESKE